MAIQNFFSYITYAFYSQYNMVWISNTEIVLDPNNSVVKRLACISETVLVDGMGILLQSTSLTNHFSKCLIILYVDSGQVCRKEGFLLHQTPELLWIHHWPQKSLGNIP